MKFTVHLVADAEQDLLSIYAYTRDNDSTQQAEEMLSRLEQKVLSLESLPERGHHPPELERVAVLAYRELHEGPYRIIYQIQGRDVFVHCILDARRELQELLQARLLR
jgi:toxin ParE1/3/4